VEPGVGATVERRTTQLLEDAKRSYERAWREFEASYEQAMSRFEELFAAYEEFLRMARHPRLAAPGEEQDLVFVLGEAGPRELAFDVRPLPPREVVEFFESGEGLAASWGEPFQ
jgi:hypothetical protein